MKASESSSVIFLSEINDTQSFCKLKGRSGKQKTQVIRSLMIGLILAHERSGAVRNVFYLNRNHNYRLKGGLGVK